MIFQYSKFLRCNERQRVVLVLERASFNKKNLRATSCKRVVLVREMTAWRRQIVRRSCHEPMWSSALVKLGNPPLHVYPPPISIANLVTYLITKQALHKTIGVIQIIQMFIHCQHKPVYDFSLSVFNQLRYRAASLNLFTVIPSQG
jgi:hypothetical protein